MIIAGILLGPTEPTEPKHDINPFLEPLVSELLTLWAGVQIKINHGTHSEELSIQCALMCAACDLPAGRKVCGFRGHSAKLGCSRCLKHFSGSVGCMNYSGFDRSEWTPRTKQNLVQAAIKLLACKTKQERNELESSSGCRNSPLVELPYFDPPRMSAVDPMHNVFSGSGKHMLHLWKDGDLVTDQHYSLIQNHISSFVVPSDVGRIPRKIETGFSGFIADQYKNWITIYVFCSSPPWNSAK